MEVALIAITGGLSAGLAVTAGVAVWHRISRRYVLDEFGQKHKIIFQQEKEQPTDYVARTRLEQVRTSLRQLARANPVEPAYCDNVVDNKLVDMFQGRQEFTTKDGLTTYSLFTKRLAPERMDPELIPAGDQVVKVCPKLEAVAREYTTFKERTPGLLQACFKKVLRELDEVGEDAEGLNAMERHQIATLSTAAGFEPSPEEIVAINHFNSGPVQQKIRLVNDTVRERPGHFQVFYESPKAYAWWSPIRHSWQAFTTTAAKWWYADGPIPESKLPL